MADGIIQLPADSTGKKLDTTEVTVGANSVHRERLQIAGGASTELADVKDDAPSTSAFGLVVRQTGAVTLSSQIAGSTYLDSANEALRVNVVTGGGSLTASSSQTFPIQLSTAPNTAYIDARQSTIVAATSGAGLGTILSTGAGGAAIDPRIISQASTWDVRVIGAASSGVSGTNLISTGLTGAAIDPRQATIVAATSGAGLGVILSTGAGGAAIDPRITSGAGSSGVTGTTLISTALAGAAIDPRQATIVAGTSGASLGTILSTGAGGAAIDARQVTLVAATSGAFVSTRWSTQTVGGSTVIDTVNEAVRVNIVAGSAAGATAALLQIQSTDGTWTNVGFAVPMVIPIGITTAHNSTTIIDPRAASLAAASSQTFPIQLSTAPDAAYIDPRQVTIVAGTSGLGLGTIISTAAGSAAIDPRLVTLQAGTTALIGAVQATIVAATSAAILYTVGSGSSGVTGTSLISTALAGAAIDPRQATIVAATSGAGLGTILSTGAGGASIDPRARTWALSSAETVAVIGTASSGVLGTVLSATGLTGAAIDPRQATIVAGTSGTGLGTIVSTGAGAAAIDPRQVTLQTGTTALVGAVAISSAGLNVSLWSSSGVNVGASSASPSSGGMGLFVRSVMGSSATVLGSVALMAGTTSNTIGSVAIVEGSSGTDVGVVMIATGFGGPAIDPRAASLSASSSQTFPVQLSTAPDAAYIDPRLVTLQAGSSGNTVGNVTVSTGSVALYSSTGAAIAVTTAAPSSDAMGVVVRIAENSSNVDIGKVWVRDFAGSTSNRILKHFYSTGFAPPTASTCIGMHQVTNLSSGSSGFSFNVDQGTNFKITYITASAQGTTANSGWVDFSIRADASTVATTATDAPVWGPARLNVSVQGATTILRQGDVSFFLSGLDIVLPSDASFGQVTVASSSTLEATFTFGGYYFVP